MLKRVKEKQAKRKEIRYIQSRTGVTVYTGRRRSSSGSRRSRSSGRTSGIYCPEQGSQLVTQGEAGDQVNTVQDE